MGAKVFLLATVLLRIRRAETRIFSLWMHGYSYKLTIFYLRNICLRGYLCAYKGVSICAQINSLANNSYADAKT